MKIHDVMTPDVEIANPDNSVREVALSMAQIDIGVLPVGENDRLVGMITDRDIAIRVVAAGLDPESTTIREVMTPEIEYCFDDDDTKAVAEKMAHLKVRRLPVLNRKKRLVGIISVGDLATADSAAVSGRAMRGAAQPGGPHAQASHLGHKH
jgi:CBS domain-containing protein